MKNTDLFKLYNFVKDRSEKIVEENYNQTRLKNFCEENLGFTVSTPTLKSVLGELGIKLKRTKTQSAKALKEQYEELRGLTTEIIHAGEFSEDFCMEIVCDEDMPSFVREAFRLSSGASIDNQDYLEDDDE